MADPASQVSLSRNEVESLAAKAARGAGFPWGAAEEAGFSAGWLHDAGFDGLTPLLSHLQSLAQADWHQMRPRWTLGGWDSQKEGIPVCPIALGMALSDFAEVGTKENDLPSKLGIAGTVAYPGLLLPFLSVLIPAGKATFEVVLGDHSLTLGRSRLSTVDKLSLDQLLNLHRSALRVRPSDAPFPSVFPQSVTTSGETLSGLDHLGLLTTVPPSARSRADAGASGSDND